MEARRDVLGFGRVGMVNNEQAMGMEGRLDVQMIHSIDQSQDGGSQGVSVGFVAGVQGADVDGRLWMGEEEERWLASRPVLIGWRGWECLAGCWIRFSQCRSLSGR